MTRLLFLWAFIACMVAGCGGKDKATDFRSARTEVIKRVKDGSISADESGKAVLPKELKAASRNGEIYVSTNADAGLSIVFLLETAPETAEAGHLYCEGQIPANTKTIRIGSIPWGI